MFKAIVPNSNEKGTILVRGVPFGSPDNRDVHGQFFSDKTNFLSHILPLPPVFHFHGAKTGSLAEPVGETLSREQKSDGVWYHVKLNLESTIDNVKVKANELWKAAKAGKLFASSGAVEATIKLAENGEILQWLVGDLSLINSDTPREFPANFHAIAVPVKADLTDVETGDLTLDTLNIHSTKSDDEAGETTENNSDNAEVTTVMESVSAYVENIYHSIRDHYPDNTALRELMLNGYRTMFGVELNPDIIRSNKMADDNNALAQLQQQVADLTTQLAVVPQLQGQVTQLTTDLTTRDGQISQLQGIVSTKSAEVAMGTHAGMVDQWINEGRITPAEREKVLEVLSFAFQADASVKGDIGFVNSIKAWVEARPINPAVGSPATVYNNMGNLNGGAVNGPGGGIDQANVDRLKRYAEIEVE